MHAENKEMVRSAVNYRIIYCEVYLDQTNQSKFLKINVKYTSVYRRPLYHDNFRMQGYLSTDYIAREETCILNPSHKFKL